MYFHRIPASAITSYGFAIIFHFIITTAVAYVPKMGDPVPACTITAQAHPYPFQWQALHWRVWFHKLRFQQKFVKLGLVV